MADINHYSAFGLQIRSDLIFPELTTASGQPQPDISVRNADPAGWPPLSASALSTPMLQMAEGDWRLQLEGIGWFRASAGNCLEWQRWDDSVSDRDLRTFLVTSGLGAVAIQRGALVLHGTALEYQGQAVLILGHPATGKSTLAWCLLQRGWRLLSSELVVVDAQGRVWPGLQQIKLWHDAVEALGVEWHQLPRVRRGLHRYACLPPALAFADQPTPIRHLYALSRDKEDSAQSQPAQVSVVHASAALSQQQAMLILRNSAFQARAVRGMGMEPQLFTKAAALVRQISMHRLRVPSGIQVMVEGLNQVDLLNPASMQIDANEGSNG